MSNRADCIKVACDIVLPWGLPECLNLAEEFRAENMVDYPWMVDVVQTKLTALHAYMNIRSQLAAMDCMEIELSETAGTSSMSLPFSFSDPLRPKSPSPEFLSPDNFVPDMDHGQQTQQSINLFDKKERNKRNRESKKEKRRTKQLQRTGEPFNCPWCPIKGSCSISILKHV